MTSTLPPTVRLPPIRRISSYSIGDISDAIKYLRLIYNPEVRGSRIRTHKDNRNSSGTGSLENTHTDLTTLRTDSFERSYAIKWLTAVISQIEPEGDTGSPLELGNENVIQDAASLLAVCAGTASAGVITRDFVFVSPLFPKDQPVIVKLQDAPLENQDYGSVGTQTWGSACVMAEMIVKDPAKFGLHLVRDEVFKEAPTCLRVLELGAGTGLVSLTVGKLMQKVMQTSHTRRGVEVVATDYYPSVLVNLENNVRSNHLGDLEKLHLTTRTLDWSKISEERALNDGPFDIILGADIIYETNHSVWIKACVEKLLRKPLTSDHEPLFHLLIPLRATHTFESNTVEEVFRQEGSLLNYEQKLAIRSKEIITCDAESGKDGEEVEYAYYRIGWS